MELGVYKFVCVFGISLCVLCVFVCVFVCLPALCGGFCVDAWPQPSI